MRRAAIFPLLGPALVLYLIADIASLRGELDALGYAIAGVAVLLSLAIVVRTGRGAREEQRGGSLVAWLGLASAIVILPLLTDEQLRVSVELARIAATCVLGGLILVLALAVPDNVLPVRLARVARWSIAALATACALVSALVVGPVIAPAGNPWLLPEVYAGAANLFAALALFTALGLRLARRRLGSGPDVLASNSWAVLALVPACVLCAILLLRHALGHGSGGLLPRLFGTLSVLALYFGHSWLIDPSRRLYAGRATRDAIAAFAAVSCIAWGVVQVRAHVPHAALPLGVWASATLLAGFALFYALRPLSQRWLAPAAGVLLDELRSAQGALGGVHTLAGLTRVVLASLRRATGVRSEPLLYGFDPGFEGRIDAAGEPHIAERPLSPAILAHLQAQPGEVIVRAPLEARIVREPPLRPLIEALIAVDALCVLPLVTDGELEGALIVPRGGRRAPLTLEELSALDSHARWLSGLLAVLSAQARAEARSHGLLLEHSRNEARMERLEDEASRLRADIEVLHAAGARRSHAAPLVAYSAALRAIVERLRTLTVHDVPVLFVAESGVSVEPLARLLHDESPRAAAAFLTLDCAAVKPEDASAVLFGGVLAGVRHAGALRLAAQGTLLLLDVIALPLEAQRLLVAALASRTGRPIDGSEAYTFSGRVLASARVEPGTLVEAGTVDAELAARLSSVMCHVPPLRSRREDIGSHALLAVDRACRRLGKPLVGFEPEALEQLCALPLAGNETELEGLIERAVARCAGPRIGNAELALAPGASALVEGDPLDGSLEEVECRALQRALARAAGNKSEAARLLGLPRTTFLDKLRRYKLDDGSRESSVPPN